MEPPGKREGLDMRVETVSYPRFTLQMIDSPSAESVMPAESGRYYRVELPSAPDNCAEMQKKGYIFADRTLGVAISLKRTELDFRKLIRFEIRPEDPNNEAILEIALSSFPSDRRFHVRPKPDDEVGEAVIRRWVKELTEVYVCVHKGEIVGFLDLEPYGEKDCFIHLAAVRERYRAAGAAVSLYAHAVLTAKEKGCEKLCGRISSTNTAVMNLYARLGATFGEPRDVFVRSE